MTLYQSDVYELLEAIRAGGDIDAIRRGAELADRDRLMASRRGLGRSETGRSLHCAS